MVQFELRWIRVSKVRARRKLKELSSWAESNGIADKQ